MTSILKKGFTAVAILVLVVSAYTITGVLIFSEAQYKKITTENLIEAAKVMGNLTPIEIFADNSILASWSAQINPSELGYRITLVRRNGQVIYDTNADSASMEDHLDRPEFQTAITGSIGSDRRKSQTLGQEYIYSSIGIKDQNGRINGVLRISQQVPSFSSLLLGSTFPFLLGAFILILAASITLYRYSRGLSHSIEVKLDSELQKKTTELIERTKEAEAEYHRHEVILNSMFDGVIALDKSKKIILANPRICYLFGVTEKEEEIKKMSLLEFSNSTELEEAAQGVLRTGQKAELTLKRYISGIEQHFQIIAAPLKANDPSGIQGAVIVMSDISRLVKLEQVRKDFAANVSHELRTPIQVIKGFAENILNHNFEKKEEVHYFAEIIAKNTQNMENLVNDLMSLVSLEDENTPHPAKEDSFIAPLFDEAKSMVEAAAEKKNITIDISCDSELSAKIYASLIVQAFINLLDNSIKYSNSGSKIKASAYLSEDNLVISVKDQGIGIHTEHIERIFERFYRVDRARIRHEANGIIGSHDEGGTGLGLAIVRHIALIHGGNVEVESHAGEGSEFRIKIPV